MVKDLHSAWDLVASAHASLVNQHDGSYLSDCYVLSWGSLDLEFGCGFGFGFRFGFGFGVLEVGVGMDWASASGSLH